MHALLYLLAVVAGAATAVQAAVNTQLKGHVPVPMQATLISFSTGAIVSLAYCLITRAPVIQWSRLSEAPWWAWTGGTLGTLFVWSSMTVAPKLGIAQMVTIVLFGQMLTALVVDHFGLLGMQAIPLSLTRGLGALLVLGGMMLFTVR
jgi:transporter family-2 protein